MNTNPPTTLELEMMGENNYEDICEDCTFNCDIHGYCWRDIQ